MQKKFAGRMAPDFLVKQDKAAALHGCCQVKQVVSGSNQQAQTRGCQDRNAASVSNGSSTDWDLRSIKQDHAGLSCQLDRLETALMPAHACMICVADQIEQHMEPEPEAMAIESDKP